MNWPGFIAGAMAWGRKEKRDRLRRAITKHKKESKAQAAKKKRAPFESAEAYWLSLLSKGKWNTTFIRKFTLRSGSFGPTGPKRDPKVEARKQEALDFRAKFTRRQWTQMRVAEVRSNNRENGLNRYGFPVYG